MTSPELRFLVPGTLDQPTGGYRYDARMVVGLRELGWQVLVRELEGCFPPPAPDLRQAGTAGRSVDARESESLAQALAEAPDGARVLIDGLAMGGLPEPVGAESQRLRILALVHHPLAEETDLDGRERDRLAGLEREALGACAGVVATSAFTAARVEAMGVSPARVRSVSPGTEPRPPAVGPPPGEPPLLLCVGSVIPRKGQDVLVRALRRLTRLPWRCVCVGSLERAPGYAGSVRRQAEAAGLAERIRFTGTCAERELEGWYDRSSLLVLPSHYEGYGMVLAEAVARGLPVVSTTGGAIPDTIPSDVGVLVPPGDDVALARVLEALLEEGPGGGRLAGMARAARRHALRLPDWPAASRAFANALLQLAPEWPRSTPDA